MAKKTPDFEQILTEQQKNSKTLEKVVNLLEEGLVKKTGDGLNNNLSKFIEEMTVAFKLQNRLLEESNKIQNKVFKKINSESSETPFKGGQYYGGIRDWAREKTQKMFSASWWLGINPESKGLTANLMRRREARREYVKSAVNIGDLSKEEAKQKFKELNRVRGKRSEVEQQIAKLQKQGLLEEDIEKYKTKEGPSLFELRKQYAEQEKNAVRITKPERGREETAGPTPETPRPIEVGVPTGTDVSDKRVITEEEGETRIPDVGLGALSTADTSINLIEDLTSPETPTAISDERVVTEEEKRVFTESEKQTNLLGSMDTELKDVHKTLKKCCERLKEAGETLSENGPLTDILTTLTGGAAAAATGGVILSSATIAAIVAGIGAALWPSSTSSTSWDPNYNPNDPNQTGPNFPQIPGGKQPYFGPGPATAPPGKSNTLNPTSLTQEDKDKQLAAIDSQIKQAEIDLQNDPSNQGKQDQLKALKAARDITAAQKATPAPLVSTPVSRISQTKKENIEEAAPYLQRASEIAGVDLDTLSNFTNLESGFNENALTPLDSNGVVPKGVADDRKRMSSAHGYGQFLNDTWAEKVKQYGSKYGVKGTGKNGEITDEDAFKVREDKMVQAGMLAEYAQEGVRLSEKYGLQDKDASIYAHHNLGPGGAEKLFKAVQNNPDAEITSIIGEKAVANNPSLYKQGMTARQAYENLGKKVREGQKYTEILKASLQNQQTAPAAQPAQPTLAAPAAPAAPASQPTPAAPATLVTPASQPTPAAPAAPAAPATLVTPASQPAPAAPAPQPTPAAPAPQSAQPAPTTQQSPDAVSALYAAEGENIHQRAILEMDLQYAQRDGDQAKVDKITKELELNQQQRDALINAQKVHQERASKAQPKTVSNVDIDDDLLAADLKAGMGTASTMTGVSDSNDLMSRTMNTPAQSKAEPIDARSAGFFGTGETVADRLAAEESWGPDKDWATEAKPVDYKPAGVVPQAALNLEQKMILAADKPKTAADILEDEFDEAVYQERKNIAEYDVRKNQEAKQKAEAIKQKDLQGLPQADVVGWRSFEGSATPLAPQPMSSADNVYQSSSNVSDTERELKTATSASNIVNAPVVNNVNNQSNIGGPSSPRNTDSAWQKYSSFTYGWGLT